MIDRTNNTIRRLNALVNEALQLSVLVMRLRQRFVLGVRQVALDRNKGIGLRARHL